MEITDIRVRLITESKERLRAVCSVTFDDAFVVRDVKVVDGTTGPFVAMPSRKLTSHCPQCRHKNPIRARFCSDCGGKLRPGRAPEDGNGRSRFHRDIAHPINTEFRELIHGKVLEAFEAELQLAQEDPQHDEPERAEKEHDFAPAADHRDAPSESADDREDPQKEYDEEREKVRNEYDSLIAGLKGGGRTEDRGERPQKSQDRGRDSGRGRGGRGRDGQRDDGASRGNRREAAVESPGKPAEPAKPVESAPVAAPVRDEEDSEFGADILNEAKTPARSVERERPPIKAEPPANRPAATPAEPQPDAADDEDEVSFGAGLV